MMTSTEAYREVSRLCVVALTALVNGDADKSEMHRLNAERWNRIAELLRGEEECQCYRVAQSSSRTKRTW